MDSSRIHNLLDHDSLLLDRELLATRQQHVVIGNYDGVRRRDVPIQIRMAIAGICSSRATNQPTNRSHMVLVAVRRAAQLRVMPGLWLSVTRVGNAAPSVALGTMRSSAGGCGSASAMRCALW